MNLCSALCFMGDNNKRIKTRSISVSVLSDSAKNRQQVKDMGKNADKKEDTNIEDKLNRIISQLDITNKGLNKLNNKFDQLNSEITQVKKEVNRNTEGIERLNNRVDSIEQYSKNCNLRFYGIPKSTEENTGEIVRRIITESLQVKMDRQDIVRVYRMEAKNENVPGAIFVGFRSHGIKAEIYSQKAKLKGTRVTIREDLTGQRMGVLKLVMEKFGKKNVWTQDGKIKWVQNGRQYTATRSEHVNSECRNTTNSESD